MLAHVIAQIGPHLVIFLSLAPEWRPPPNFLYTIVVIAVWLLETESHAGLSMSSLSSCLCLPSATITVICPPYPSLDVICTKTLECGEELVIIHRHRNDEEEANKSVACNQTHPLLIVLKLINEAGAKGGVTQAWEGYQLRMQTFGLSCRCARWTNQLSSMSHTFFPPASLAM